MTLIHELCKADFRQRSDGRCGVYGKNRRCTLRDMLYRGTFRNFAVRSRRFRTVKRVLI